jgi:hypothetical protein
MRTKAWFAQAVQLSKRGENRDILHERGDWEKETGTRNNVADLLPAAGEKRGVWRSTKRVMRAATASAGKTARFD